MRKFLFCLLTLFAITPAFSENYIVFSSHAVEDAINTFVAADNRAAARDEYQKQMDATTGKISVSGVYKVCNAAGFKVKDRGGYNDCQTFVGMIIAGSGFGTGSESQKSCSEEMDGIWTQTQDGKKYQCVGRDGAVLTYRNACKDKKDGDAASQCWESTFSGIYLQYAVAKNAIQTWAKEKLGGIELTCKNQPVMGKNKDPYLYCSAKGKPYTFKFSGFGPEKNSDLEKANIMMLMCKFADQKLSYAWAESAKRGVGGTCLCSNCDATGSETYPLTDIGEGIEKCSAVGKWGQRLGGYSTTQVNDGSAVLKKGGHASPIRHDMCFIYGGQKSSTTGLVNELAAEGVDNLIFFDIEVRNSEDILEKVRGHVRDVMGANKVKSVECDTTTRRMSQVGVLGIFEHKTADIIRCKINGKNVDFAFKNLSTVADYRVKGGLQGMECKINGGVFTGKECAGLDKDKCKKIQEQSAEVCPECKEIYWDNKLEACLLPNSAKVRALDKGVQIGIIVGTTAAAVTVTVATGGATGLGGALLVAEIIGADIELESTIKIGKAAQDFLHTSANCKDAACAETLVKSQLQRLSNMQNDFTDTEVFEIDREFARLFNLIPETSEVFNIDAKKLEENRLSLFDSDSWEPEQVWRAVGVGLQMLGLVAGLTKFFTKGTTKLPQSTKVIKQKFTSVKALPAPAETKLITHVDDEVKLLAAPKLERSEAKALQDIAYRDSKRAAGTATAHERSLAKADFQKQQELLKKHGFRNTDDMYMEARAVMQTDAIMQAESELAKAEERLAYLTSHNGSKADIRAIEGRITRIKNELADMGRTYSEVAETTADAARTTSVVATNTDDVARAAATMARNANNIDDAYQVGRTVSTRSEILEKWGLRADATDAEITARYRELSRNFHPDRAGAEFTDVMADINKERELLRTLPYENPSRLLALPEAATETVKTTEAIPMIGHNLIGAAAAGRALSRLVDPNRPDVPGVVDGTGYSYSIETTPETVPGGVVVVPGDDDDTIVQPSGVGSNEIPTTVVSGGTGGNVENGFGGTTSGTTTSPVVTPSGTTTSTTNNTQSTQNNNQKKGISGLGVAAIGAGVAGLGVGAALLIGGAGKDKGTSTTTTTTGGNVDVFNGLGAKTSGVVGYVDGVGIELVVIETVSGTSEKIVSINNRAVVLAKHNGNTIPFMVDMKDGVAQWVPFTNVDATTGVFTKYKATTDIMRTAKIGEELGRILPPMQTQYFAARNQDGIVFPAPSTKGYQTINNNALRYLNVSFNQENTRLGVFLFV